MTRCRWCGVFTRWDTAPTRWRSRDADHVWHDHEANLCPRCHEAAVTDPWWIPIGEDS